MDTRLQRPLLIALLAVASLAAMPASAQGDARAQIVQLQQQLQKLRQDNAQLGVQLRQAQAQAAGADKARAEIEAARGEARRLRGSAASGQQQLRELQRQNEERSAELSRVQAESEQLRGELARRAEAVSQANAALARAREDAAGERSVLSARLRQASTRADQCEAQQARALSFGDELVQVLETERVGVREPFIGLWRVREEQRVQQWRDRLQELRAPAPAADRAAPAQPARP